MLARYTLQRFCLPVRPSVRHSRDLCKRAKGVELVLRTAATVPPSADPSDCDRESQTLFVTPQAGVVNSVRPSRGVDDKLTQRPTSFTALSRHFYDNF